MRALPTTRAPWDLGEIISPDRDHRLGVALEGSTLLNFASEGSWSKVQESKGPKVQVSFTQARVMQDPCAPHRAERCISVV